MRQTPQPLPSALGRGRGNLSKRPSGKRLRASRPLKNYDAPPPLRPPEARNDRSAIDKMAAALPLQLSASHLSKAIERDFPRAGSEWYFKSACAVPRKLKVWSGMRRASWFPMAASAIFFHVKKNVKSFVERKGGRSANFVSNPMACRAAIGFAWDSEI